MTDSPTQPDDVDDMGRSRGHTPPIGMPRWVKVFAVVGIILVVLLLVGLLAGGNHGPGRHIGDAGSGSALAAVTHSVDAGAHPALPAGHTRG